MADLAASLGMPLDEWQEQALEAAMGERSDGRWSSKFVGMSVPRQNGKSQIIVARALAGVLLFDEKMIIISAHETDTAREVWKRMIDVIEDNPHLEARLTGRMDAINREFLSFGKGAQKQTIKLKARQKSGVRGFSADCLLLDEAQILGKRAWGSIVPTMSARPNPQLWLFGTPPTEDDDPFAFERVRESSIKGKVRHCWLEWSAEPDDNYDDPVTWAKANPSFGVRVSREACADDRAAMDDEQFAVERLGIWPTEQGSGYFTAGRWLAGMDAESTIEGPPALGIAVSLDRKRVCIGASGLNPAGRRHLEPIWHGSVALAAVEAQRLATEHKATAVAIAGTGPGADLVPALEKLIPANLLRVMTVDDEKTAASDVTDLVEAVGHAHLDDPDLNAAVRAAVPKPVGDRFVIGRRKSTKDTSTFEACAYASWASARSKTYNVLDSVL